MFNSRIAIALLSAISSLGRAVAPWEQPAPPIPEGWDFGANRRSRGSTKIHNRYFHKDRLMTEQRMGRHGRVEVAGQYWESKVPMRRAERKGINTVPRGHGDKNAIRF